MPYPANRDTALAVEQVIRDNGAVPATIAILHGRVHVGLGAGEIEALAKTGKAARKTSRRDLALVVAQKGMGATTVSGTMVVAAMAGIRVFVTGGIGGVHRGGEASMDVSADLTELGRTPVAVVCAGVKSILDIPRTLEYLETHVWGCSSPLAPLHCAWLVRQRQFVTREDHCP
jgi:pseudouridine-5'-phosphate glycosidase